MIDARLIEGEADPNRDMPSGGIFVITGLTWTAHDFLHASLQR